jgi:DNA repair protein SbcC/Rad50
VKLVEVRLRDLPGLARDLVLERIDAGATVLLGPNGSGKTSLARGVRDLLFARRDAPGSGHAVWSLDAERIESRYAPGRPLAFAPREPRLPDARFARLFFLDLDAFRAKDRSHVDDELRRVLGAGYDVRNVRSALVSRWRSTVAWNAANRAAKDADDAASRIEGELRDLDATRASIDDLTRRIAGIDDAQLEAKDAERAVAALDAAEMRDRARDAMGAMPVGIENVVPDDVAWLASRLERRVELQSADSASRARALDEELRRLPDVSGFMDLARRVDPIRDRDEQRELVALVAEAEAELSSLDVAATPDARAPTRAEIAELEERVRAAEHCEREHEVAARRAHEERERLASLPAVESGELEKARSLLEEWLDAEPDARRTDRTQVVLLALSAASLVGVGFLSRSEDRVLLLLPLGLAVAFAYMALARRVTPDDGRRASVEGRFARTGVRAPAAWRVADVAARRTEIEVALHTSIQRAGIQADVEATAAEELRRREKATRARSAVQEWLAAHGIAVQGSIDAITTAQRIAHAAQLRSTLAERRSRLARARDRIAATR